MIRTLDTDLPGSFEDQEKWLVQDVDSGQHYLISTIHVEDLEECLVFVCDKNARVTGFDRPVISGAGPDFKHPQAIVALERKLASS